MSETRKTKERAPRSAGNSSSRPSQFPAGFDFRQGPSRNPFKEAGKLAFVADPSGTSSQSGRHLWVQATNS